ncbi:hypothetical protein ACA350_00390 [Orientia tsutsugamushi]|uniref:hypothetical protein n=1 Tax=Orientia tsutsugamushi TaxID=784 RepID=UPI003527E871
MLKSHKRYTLSERKLLVQQVLSSQIEYHDDGESSKYFTTTEVRNDETRIKRLII